MVGSINFYTFKEPNPPPLSLSGCVNASSTVAAANATSSVQDYPFSFFNLSYLYLTPACLIVGFVCSTVVSLLTGELFSTLQPVWRVHAYAKLIGRE